jgi:hypothetical protein
MYIYKGTKVNTHANQPARRARHQREEEEANHFDEKKPDCRPDRTDIFEASHG